MAAPPAVAPAVAPPVPAVAPPPAPTPDPTPLFQMMRDIYVRAKSGHLHFSHAAERRSLYFVRGLILYGTSDVEGEHLGNTLVRYGLLSQEDLERATPSVLRDRKRLQGKIRAMSSEAKAGASIIGSLPPGVMAMITISTPTYMAPMFTVDLGKLMLGGCLVWMGLGILVMKKMVSFKY